MNIAKYLSLLLLLMFLLYFLLRPNPLEHKPGYVPAGVLGTITLPDAGGRELQIVRTGGHFLKRPNVRLRDKSSRKTILELEDVLDVEGHRLSGDSLCLDLVSAVDSSRYYVRYALSELDP